MKTLLVFPFLIVCLEGNAQSDTTRQLPDTVVSSTAPDPDSWYNSELPRDAGPQKDSVLLTNDELPSSLRRALNAKDQFKGWRRGKIYFDLVNKNYRLFFPRDENTECFTLDKKGNTLSYTSFITP